MNYKNVIAKVKLLEAMPYIGTTYKHSKYFDYEYRMIFVAKYIVFYVVIEETVEIHRVIYSKCKMNKLI